MTVNRYINEIPTQKSEIIKGEFVCMAYDSAIQRIKNRNEVNKQSQSEKLSEKNK